MHATRSFTRWILFAGTMVLLSDASVVKAQSAAYAWGGNGGGQLGNGTTTNSAVPTMVNTLSSGVGAVAAGDDHALGIRIGAAYAWGFNGNGQLGNNSTTNSPSPVQVTGLGNGVTAVAGGLSHSVAIQNGAAYAWGYNGHGELGNNSTTQSNVPVAVANLSSGVTAIAAGGSYSMAIQNGVAYAWGSNYYGQLGNSSMTNSSVPVVVSGLTSGVSAIAAGGSSLAIMNGAAYAWGDNISGQLGNGTTTNSAVPIPVPGLSSGVTSVAAGNQFSLAVQNGNVFAWGDNGSGQLGNGTTSSSSSPIQVDAADLKNIVAVASGAASSYALAPDGSLWVWGYNNDGELGLGNVMNHSTPQHLLPPTGYYYASIDSDANGRFAVAIVAPLSSKIASVTRAGNGHVLLQGTGTPNVAYRVQATDDLTANNFAQIGTATADANGLLQYDDAGAVGLARRFYRLSAPY